jgi:hypothetical protein
MPGCVLRVAGQDFAVDEFLTNSHLRPCAVWRHGERRTPHGPPSRNAGFNLVVSDAPGCDLPSQVRDAIQFLTEHYEALARLMAWKGVEGAVLDFGVERRDVVVQCDTLPAALIRLAGGLGLAIEMSLYPKTNGKSEV